MKLSAGEIDAIIAGCSDVTPGPWKVYDGSSWRRIGTVDGRYDDCAVLAPIVASDGHPDMCAGRGQDTYANLHHIANLHPVTVLALATEVKRDREANAVLLRCIDMAMGCLDLHSSNRDEALAWYRLLDAKDGREPRVALANLETHSGTDE